MCSKISEYFTCGGDPYPGGWSCVHSEIRVCTRARVSVWALRRVACTDLTSSGYNGNQQRVLRNISSAHRVHPLCLLPEPGTTVVRPIRGRPGGVFLYLIFAVPGNGYLTTGYTRSWSFPYFEVPGTLVVPTTTSRYQIPGTSVRIQDY